ncbi:hypothetical protein BT67DRAFT_289514 [Trichocladium antarcticum]|uniref:Uncharacterized protein n=1 Tax=Trichocladium antarcticum TaxID=1450529 RepID=A0AAN6ZE58_9PEZI|nr:hypothetical protein BT67DRAFT_289514 [Trichocladium antarcticum]
MEGSTFLTELLLYARAAGWVSCITRCSGHFPPPVCCAITSPWQICNMKLSHKGLDRYPNTPLVFFLERFGWCINWQMTRMGQLRALCRLIVMQLFFQRSLATSAHSRSPPHVNQSRTHGSRPDRSPQSPHMS